jgi:hypothetical protein
MGDAAVEAEFVADSSTELLDYLVDSFELFCCVHTMAFLGYRFNLNRLAS